MGARDGDKGTMSMLDHNGDDGALRELEAYAHDLAAGRVPRANIASALDRLNVSSPGGSSLIRILQATSQHVAESRTARRQFFHAARALVAMRRDLAA